MADRAPSRVPQALRDEPRLRDALLRGRRAERRCRQRARACRRCVDRSRGRRGSRAARRSRRPTDAVTTDATAHRRRRRPTWRRPIATRPTRRPDSRCRPDPGRDVGRSSAEPTRPRIRSTRSPSRARRPRRPSPCRPSRRRRRPRTSALPKRHATLQQAAHATAPRAADPVAGARVRSAGVAARQRGVGDGRVRRRDRRALPRRPLSSGAAPSRRRASTAPA